MTKRQNLSNIILYIKSKDLQKNLKTNKNINYINQTKANYKSTSKKQNYKKMYITIRKKKIIQKIILYLIIFLMKTQLKLIKI